MSALTERLVGKQHTARRPDNWWWLQLGARALFWLTGIVALSFSIRAHRYGVVVIVAVVLLFSAFLVHSRLSTWTVGEDRTGPSQSTKFLVLAFTVQVGVGLVVAAEPYPFSALGFAGVSLAAFGGGQFGAQIRDSNRFQRPIAVLLGVDVIALLVVSTGFLRGGFLALVAAAMLAFVALSVTSEVFLNWAATWPKGPRGSAPNPSEGAPSSGGDARKPRTVRDRNWQITVLAGALCFVAGTLLVGSTVGLTFGLLVAVILALLVYPIASNTDFDLLLVICFVAIVWSQFPRTTSETTHPNVVQPPHLVDHVNASKAKMIVFGDSYISGEGAKSYFDGTNVDSRTRHDECRRAATSYPVLAGERAGLQVFDFACSGAVVDNIVKPDGGQYTGENPPDSHPQPQENGRPGVYSQLQLYQKANIPPSQVSVVLLSIGGNDVGFGDIVASCIVPGNCAERGQKWLNQLTKLPAALAPVYKQLATMFPDKVVVVPYPVPLAERACGLPRSTFTNAEHAFLNGFAAQLDDTIERTASSFGLRYFSDAKQAFRNSKTRICDASLGHTSANYIGLNPVEGPINPRGWLHNSMHPNQRGHALLADILYESYLSHSTLPPVANEPPPPPVNLAAAMNATQPGTGDRVPNVCSEGKPSSRCELSDSAWMALQTDLAARRKLGPLVLIIGGAWAVSVWVISTLRRARKQRATSGA